MTHHRIQLRNVVCRFRLGAFELAEDCSRLEATLARLSAIDVGDDPSEWGNVAAQLEASAQTLAKSARSIGDLAAAYRTLSRVMLDVAPLPAALPAKRSRVTGGRNA